MTERQGPFESSNQTPEDTGLFSREAFEEHKRRIQEKQLWQYVDDWSTEDLERERSELKRQIETYKSRGRVMPDLADKLTIVVKAIGVKRHVAAEIQVIETNRREMAEELRRDLEIIERGLGGDSRGERIKRDTPVTQFEQPNRSEDSNKEPLLEVGSQIRVNGVLTDIGRFTAEERRECVEDLRSKGERVELVERLSASDNSSKHTDSVSPREGDYVRQGDLAMLPEIHRHMEKLAEARRQAGEPEMTQKERLAYVEELSKSETTGQVRDLSQTTSTQLGATVASRAVVGEDSTVDSEVISASLSVGEWTNSKQAEYIPSADEILRGARLSHRTIEFIKQRPAITGLGALAVIAVAIATPLSMSKLQATPQEIAANISLELPEGGIELASECITADKYDEASSMQLVDGVVPFDLKKPDGTSYKFNDDKGTVRIGNDIVLTGAEVYLGACAADEKESAVSVDGTTITIHRNKVGRQMLVTPSGIEGAIKAQPVNADMAGKLVFNQPENKEKLVGYFAGSAFEALVDSGAAALGEATLKDKAVRAKLDKALDDALVKDLQDDIADIAKRSKVEANKITTELQGEYGQVEMLNVKNDIEGATVITDLVTVKVTKGK